MTAIKADIARQALEQLGVLAADEAPSAADQVRADAAVQSVHDDLYQREIADWSVEAVPDYATEGYATCAADILAPYFGLPPDPTRWRRGEGMVVRGAGARHDQYKPTPAEYF